MKYPPERIVCLTEETVETLYLLGEEKRIVGVTGYAIRPSRVRKEKIRVSSFISAKIDKILALKPDLVLTFSDIQADISKNLIKEGLNVFCFNQRDVSGIIAMIETLGALLNCQKKSSELISKITSNIIKTRELQPRYKPSIYFEEWDDPLISGIGWVSDLIDIAGGVDIFSELSSKPDAKSRIISSKDVIKRNPEIILASWCGKMVKPEQIAARKGWNNIKAIQNQKIYEIKSSIILQPGPAALFDGLDAIVKIINNYTEQ